MSYHHHEESPHSPMSSTSQLTMTQSTSSRPAFYPDIYDPDISTGGFQMNPLSMHPPRTPKPSLVGGKAPFPSLGDPEKSDTYYDEQHVTTDDATILNSGMSTGKSVTQLRNVDVWREILLASNGRDKALKLIQYTIKLQLLIHKTLTKGLSLKSSNTKRIPGAWETELLSRLTSGASGLSLARKCLLLFNWLTPLALIHQPEESLPFSKPGLKKPTSKPFLYAFLHAPPPVLLDFINGAAEDISTSAKLGLIKGKIGSTAGKLADWTWFAATIVALVELSMERSLVRQMTQEAESRLYSETMQSLNGTPLNKEGHLLDEQELRKLKDQLYWIRVTRLKLIMDLIFVSYDLFQIRRGSEVVKTLTGLASGCLSSMKLFDKQRSVLLKSKSISI